jgi:hypothetical protein
MPCWCDTIVEQSSTVSAQSILFIYRHIAYYLSLTSKMRIVALLLACFSVSFHVNAFSVVPSASSSSHRAVTTSLRMTVLTYGSKKKDFKPGSAMSSAMSALGVPIKYSCKKVRSSKVTTQKVMGQ